MVRLALTEVVCTARGILVGGRLEYVSLIQDRCDGLNQDHPTTRRLVVTV